jgi:hypothetical protein
LLTETTVLAGVGGLAGVLLAWWGTRSVAALNLDQLPRGYEIQLDPVGLGFAIALIVGVGIVLGVAPALGFAHESQPGAARREPRRNERTPRATGPAPSRDGAGGHRAGAADRSGLLLASFRAVLKMDFGFNQTNVMTANVNLPGANYAQPAQRGAFIDRALERLRGIPGVTHAGATTALPFSGALSNNVIMAEGHVSKPGESLLAPSQVLASTGYFESMQIPIVKGRPFEARDTAEATPVAIIDDRLAERFWPGQDPIGRRLYRPAIAKDVTKITKDTVFFTVVGIAKEVVTADPKTDVLSVGTFYFPFEQTRRAA